MAEVVQAAFDGDTRRLVEPAAPDETQVRYDAGEAPQRSCSADVLDRIGDSDAIGDPTLQRILPRPFRTAIALKIVTTEVDGRYYSPRSARTNWCS